jgi:N-acetylglucosamine kinase-like BadF-type ATPase
MFIAVDAGGTSTRAVAISTAGDVFGYGRSGGGNPTSAGVPGAVAAIGSAVEAAVAGLPTGEVEAVVLAMAGERSDAFFAQLAERIGGLGLGPVVMQPDLLAMFHSGTHRLEGYGMVAGTGSIAARVRDGALHRVVGGKGWLLGDAGSGFWIGHRVARAVVSALDGQGPTTALTPLVLEAVGIADDPAGSAVRRLVSTLYARRPVQLAEFAPLAFAAAEDPVARAILSEAADALADLLTTVREPGLDGPVVLGGSVLVRGFLAGPAELRDRLQLPPEVVTASDGVVGAAVLALRDTGIVVDQDLFDRIRHQLADIVKDRAP